MKSIIFTNQSSDLQIQSTHSDNDRKLTRDPPTLKNPNVIVIGKPGVTLQRRHLLHAPTSPHPIRSTNKIYPNVKNLRTKKLRIKQQWLPINYPINIFREKIYMYEMESELKILSPKPVELQPEPVISVGDDRPLLKPEPKFSQTHTLSTEELEKKYAAYVRHDVYGTMGRGELPWTEKILLALGLVLLVPLRVLAGMAILVIYYVICRVCTAFLAPNREDEQEDYAHMGGWRRAVIMQSGRFLTRSLLFVFGFYRICERSPGNQVDGQLNHEVLVSCC